PERMRRALAGPLGKRAQHRVALDPEADDAVAARERDMIRGCEQRRCEALIGDDGYRLDVGAATKRPRQRLGREAPALVERFCRAEAVEAAKARGGVAARDVELREPERRARREARSVPA